MGSGRKEGREAWKSAGTNHATETMDSMAALSCAPNANGTWKRGRVGLYCETVLVRWQMWKSERGWLVEIWWRKGARKIRGA